MRDSRNYLKNKAMEAKEYLFERCLIRYVVKKFYKDGEPNYSEFARMIFYDRSDPVTTFRNVRQGKPKPQRINVEEAARMAKCINLEFASLCWNIQQELENGWTLADDFNADEASPGPKSKKNKVLTECVVPEKKEVPTHNTSGRPTPAVETDSTHIN